LTRFQQHAVLLIAIWLLLVAARFRNSRVVLIGGLFAIGLYALVAVVGHGASMHELGLTISVSWLRTIVFAVAWLALMLAYSPLADRLATRWVEKPPTLDAFRALQQSRSKLLMGIVVAWILGGFLEELVFRGIVLQSIEALVSAWLVAPMAAGVAVFAAAAGAGVIHLYQGLRAVLIITQLSILFGVLFVVSGYNLWAVILCHGLYDTIAFVRFANKKSSYSKLVADS
jgi:membrane protease YdiL (CAAX protease family)